MRILLFNKFSLADAHDTKSSGLTLRKTITTILGVGWVEERNPTQCTGLVGFRYCST